MKGSVGFFNFGVLLWVVQDRFLICPGPFDKGSTPASSCRANFYILFCSFTHSLPGKYCVSQCVGGRFTLAYAQLNLATSAGQAFLFLSGFLFSFQLFPYGDKQNYNWKRKAVCSIIIMMLFNCRRLARFAWQNYMTLVMIQSQVQLFDVNRMEIVLIEVKLHTAQNNSTLQKCCPRNINCSIGR